MIEKDLKKLNIKIEIRSKDGGYTLINRDDFDKAINDLKREKEFE